MNNKLYIAHFTITLYILQPPLTAQTKWTLSDCIEYAVKNDLYLKEARLNIDYSKKTITGAYGNLLPGVQAYADHAYNFGSVIDPTTNNRVSMDIQSNSFSLGTSLEVFNWGNFVRIKSAKLNREKAEYDVEVRKNELIIRIVQAYYQMQYDKKQIELIDKQLENTNIHVVRIETEVEVGNKAKSDLYEIRAQLANEQQLKVNAVNTFQKSKLTLKNILNLRDEADFETEENIAPELLVESMEELYEQSLQIRPEILSAGTGEEISRLSVTERKSGYLPVINANYSWSTFYVDMEMIAFNRQLRNNKNHYVGFSLNVPVFNKLQVRTAVEQAKVEWEQSKLRIEQQKQVYYTALSEAYINTQNAYDKWQASENNLKAQQISFEKTEEKFRQAMVDAYGYFNAKNNLLNAENEVLQSKFTYHYESLLLKFYTTNVL